VAVEEEDDLVVRVIEVPSGAEHVVVEELPGGIEPRHAGERLADRAHAAHLELVTRDDGNHGRRQRGALLLA
jgi:hypothetical protein